MKHEKLQHQYAAIAQHFDVAARRSSSTFDVEAYLGLLDDVDMTEAEKRALVQTLGAVVMSFVDLSFGCHPLQQACGKQVKNIDFAAETDSNGMKPT